MTTLKQLMRECDKTERAYAASEAPGEPVFTLRVKRLCYDKQIDLFTAPDGFVVKADVLLQFEEENRTLVLVKCKDIRRFLRAFETLGDVYDLIENPQTIH